MKIWINLHTRNKVWGGGNQFLRALKKTFKDLDSYAEKLSNADVVLFTGYQEVMSIAKFFFFHNQIPRVYRLGPIMSLHRKGIKWLVVDYLVAIFASLFADVVIFQSEWSYKKAKNYGFFKKKNVHIIKNVADPDFFYKPKYPKRINKPVQLIYSSWSQNVNKGFSYLKFMDQNLDFNKYSLTFIGNSPICFTNIKMIPPLASKELGGVLRNSDMFISPTMNDACSNAILEALSCGLPVVALDSGGNGELVGRGGLLFSNEREMLDAIDRVSQDIEGFSSQIVVPTIEDVASEYLEAIRASIK